MCGRNNRGFTLIELLVVIAIIAVLAAILFPVFTNARDCARRSTCSSNLRQLGIALVMYAENNGGNFPPYAGKWALNVLPQIKNKGVYFCPSDGKKFDGKVSYFVNVYISYWNGRWRGTPMSAFKRPARCVMLGDGELIVGYNTIDLSDYTWSFAVFKGRHLDGDNISFVDGHVRWYKSLGKYAPGPRDDPYWRDIGDPYNITFCYWK